MGAQEERGGLPYRGQFDANWGGSPFKKIRVAYVNKGEEVLLYTAKASGDWLTGGPNAFPIGGGVSSIGALAIDTRLSEWGVHRKGCDKKRQIKLCRIGVTQSV